MSTDIKYQQFTFQYTSKNHSRMEFKEFNIRPSKKKIWFSDNGFQKKGKVGRVFIFCFYFQSNMGRVFIFCFYFQRFKNITQASSILLFWQTNNTIVFTLSTGRIVHGTICLERNCTLKLTRTVFSLVAMLNFYFRFRLISHSNVCQKKTCQRHRHA